MHEIKCDDCGKHLGWIDPMDNIGEFAYCDGCALLKGVEEARKFIPSIKIDSSENVGSTSPHPAR
jgi:hypothetical protein